MEIETKCDTTKRLVVSALSAFIGAFLGSYFIVHQFLLREYPAMRPFMKHCPLQQTNRDFNPFDNDFRPQEAKRGCKFKMPMNNENDGTIYVIMSGKDLKDMPFDVENVHKRIMQMK